jgi:3-methyladenine DNA glycosylase Tag
MDEISEFQKVEYRLSLEDQEILMRWRHFKPTAEQSRRYIKINRETQSLARLLMLCCPDSPELKNSLDRLEEARQWANTSIMRNEAELEP